MDSATLKVLKELGLFTSSVTEASSPYSDPIDALAELGVNLKSPGSKIPRNDTLELFGLNDFAIAPIAIPEKAVEKHAVSLTPSTHSTNRTPTRSSRDKRIPKPSPTSKQPQESRINRRETPRRAAEANNVGAYMYEKGIQFKETKQENNEKMFKHYYPFKPELNPNSIAISQHSKSPRMPLHQPRRRETPTAITPQISQQTSTKSPKLNLKDFIKRNYENPLEDYKTRIRRPSQERDIPDNECTFSPNLNRSSLQIAQSAGNDDDIYNRTLKILERRKKWQDDQVKTKQQDEVRGCTFRPKTVNYRNSSGNKSPVMIKDPKQLQYAQRKKSIMNSLEASIQHYDDVQDLSN